MEQTYGVHNRIRILSTNIDALTMAQTIRCIETLIAARKPVQHVVVNAAKIVALNSQEKLREIINSCALINADGQSVVWAARILGKPVPERVTGIDLFFNLVSLASRKGYRIYLLGATEEVVVKVLELFQARYPGLQIAGYHNGYFNQEENDTIVDNIRQANADILFVAMSSPQKEFWLAENLDKLGVPFCMGVGGSFDVAAGKSKRAPNWMQKLGLEWAYRLIQEPRRMWKRYLVGNLSFIALVFKAKIQSLR